MTDWAAALTSIAAAFAEPVTYLVDGHFPVPVDVVWSNGIGDPFQGAGETTRTISCEIAQTAIPARPTKADVIERNGVLWRPQQVVDRDDLAAWKITLEQV